LSELVTVAHTTPEQHVAQDCRFSSSVLMQICSVIPTLFTSSISSSKAMQTTLIDSHPPPDKNGSGQVLRFIISVEAQFEQVATEYGL